MHRPSTFKKCTSFFWPHGTGLIRASSWSLQNLNFSSLNWFKTCGIYNVNLFVGYFIKRFGKVWDFWGELTAWLSKRFPKRTYRSIPKKVIKKRNFRKKIFYGKKQFFLITRIWTVTYIGYIDWVTVVQCYQTPPKHSNRFLNFIL